MLSQENLHLKSLFFYFENPKWRSAYLSHVGRLSRVYGAVPFELEGSGDKPFKAYGGAPGFHHILFSLI